jgi:hypothetical protein
VPWSHCSTDPVGEPFRPIKLNLPLFDTNARFYSNIKENLEHHKQRQRAQKRGRKDDIEQQGWDHGKASAALK